MAYNLLLDSSLKKLTHWKFINCKYEDGYLISTGKVFGIEQEIVLPDPTKLYFRWEYQLISNAIKEVIIGIQEADVLHSNNRTILNTKPQFLSVVDIVKQEQVKLHLIFESTSETNKVKIYNPLLCDLERLSRYTSLKWVLDKDLEYRLGYSYDNLLKLDLVASIEDSLLKRPEFEKGRIGIIAKTVTPISIPLYSAFKEGVYYLAKLDYKQGNNLGKTTFKYGAVNSTKLGDEQSYILFKARPNINLTVNIEPDDLLPYIVNLKHVLLIELTGLQLFKEDIPYIPFV